VLQGALLRAPGRSPSSGTGIGCDKFERDGGPCAAGDADGSVVTMDLLQVASSCEACRTARGGSKLSGTWSLRQVVEEDDSGIESFFGQLWFIPKPRVRPTNSNLQWIRCDLWESRKFGPHDSFPVLPGDVLRSDVKRGTFSEDLWGQGERLTFRSVRVGDMAGRGCRGRGRGRGHGNWGGFEDE
jgi:hypothetical protein